MKRRSALRRRDVGLLALPALLYLLPFRRRKKERSAPFRRGLPRIPEKPFREEDLWKPHDFAG